MGSSGPGQRALFVVGGSEAERKPPKARLPNAMRDYAEAYAAGIRDAVGGEFTPPTDSHAQLVFRNVLRAHAKDQGGVLLTGALLLLWIRQSAAEYRRARADKAAYESGFKPAKWQAWLDSGKAGIGPPSRASPSRNRVQGAGELDRERIERESEERARAANEAAAAAAAAGAF